MKNLEKVDLLCIIVTFVNLIVGYLLPYNKVIFGLVLLCSIVSVDYLLSRFLLNIYQIEKGTWLKDTNIVEENRGI